MREKRREEREEKRRERRYHRLRKKREQKEKESPPPPRESDSPKPPPRTKEKERRCKKPNETKTPTISRRPKRGREQGTRRRGTHGRSKRRVQGKERRRAHCKKNLCSSFSFLGSLPNCSLSHTLPALLLGPRSLFIGRENKEKRNKDSSNGLRSQGPRRRGRGRLRLGGARRREARIRRGGGAIFAFRALAGRLCRGPGLLDYLCRRRKDHFGPSRGRGAPGGGLGLDGEKGGGKEAGERESKLTFFCRGVVCLFQEKKTREPR